MFHSDPRTTAAKGICSDTVLKRTFRLKVFFELSSLRTD